ncbi:TIGR02710 family CRISPR-associated CARF protein [[Limnothrix rosea] IAM M-220]|uniref:TIGR02710 family CRISPR-associated CARF protein n=1 Tax=[Limnothrix rosea] IAM M-220 TaxID=454133 RepID=UPI00095F27F2|nr:TIGR02710 family CRISPR-associated CARF protein [[Limnothrix rosea] IAM M-220]OKH18644.1 CRISPR-associated protein [[Limnothrix rosea] IAM M-220]
MTKILLITVGGSHQPIATSIQSLQPNRTIFICSGGQRGSISQVTGDGKPCEVRRGAEVLERLPNIPTQLGLSDFDPDRDVVLLKNPDDLSEGYQKISEKVREIQAAATTAELVADYTGGTKTMSVALATVALDYDLRVYITTAQRTNLIKVERGERVRRATVTGLTIQRVLEQDLPRFLGQYNYPAAIAALEVLLRDTESADLGSVEAHLNFCVGLDLWDRFDHGEAWGYLEPFLSQPSTKDLVLFLKRVIGSRQFIAPAVDDRFEGKNGIKGHGYEIVQDLLFNAERRASQQRFDDAVARLYRAIELLGQVRLWQEYQIKTGDLELEMLPKALRGRYGARRNNRNGKIQIGLIPSYELLRELSDEPLGELYGEYKDRLLNKLQFRNFSILAHGMNPVTHAEYGDFWESLGEFMQQGIGRLTAGSSFSASQFPRRLSLPLSF